MSIIDPATVRYCLAQGMTQTELAREYGVTRQYIHKLAKQAGHEPLRTIVTENFPWPVKPEFYNNHLYITLRAIGTFNLDPTAVRETTLRGVRSVLRKIQNFNTVIDCDPGYPAVPGLVNTPGFAYVPRTESDENFIVKIKPETRITPIGRKLWRMPEGVSGMN
ncbi:helix-turn-helix domain-containing protein [Corynebacterium pseudodiphtheriticum]|uniref:helix-turn-helix domain-containing protein n=1 Tax=Corynebacterium pseudodiphtheriticum TaxID=37637 RepID=UPI002543BE81|nr:helix-turn-helix transcriptional regulator [Corynebacterium pseudodiphtheriticum]MDK4207004.1 helix-turn-helix transcriptional regulator [Corynebacterium pseudodiphtheriticum]MDK4284341.1 helix-turn-helix transcriptional regulator [Corynebacterium pseudodiphtheriticum]MDK8396693.1 helix-turn-helix transcriptional regulator [Corynebacterium pseudodiphtheriticum]